MNATSIVPPRGAKLEETPSGFLISCATRSSAAVFLVPFTLVWSGVSLSGIYGSQIANGKFNLGSSIFGIIFVIGTVFLVRATLMSVFGEVCFELRGDVLHYFSGIHPLGKRRKLNWNSIETAREAVESWGKGGRPYHAIHLEGAERHVVGESLSASHRYFVVSILNARLKKHTS